MTEKTTAWITTYALTNGISTDVITTDNSAYAFGRMGYGPRDWHRTEAAAIERAEEMRDAKLASLYKQVEEIMALRFGGHRDGCTVTRQPVTPGYEPLADVLDQALWQAQHGKGQERHASGEPFVDQPIVQICEDLGSPQFAIGQAHKKSREALRLGHDGARRELLGAINYLAAAVLVLDRAILRAHQGLAAIPRLPDGEVVESGPSGRGDL